jgi:hypothetical protein
MYYTYLWLRENGTPYYVGKGCKERAYRKHTFHGEAPPLGRIVFYIAKDEAEAFDIEATLIWYYGRKDLGLGCLRNLTDGGDGISGHKHSVESRKKMSEAVRPPLSKESCEKISKANMGKHKYWEGKVLSQEHRHKIAQRHKPRPQATCHPEMPHYCKGLCMVCYNAQHWRKTHGTR